MQRSPVARAGCLHVIGRRATKSMSARSGPVFQSVIGSAPLLIYRNWLRPVTWPSKRWYKRRLRERSGCPDADSHRNYIVSLNNLTPDSRSGCSERLLRLLSHLLVSVWQQIGCSDCRLHVLSTTKCLAYWRLWEVPLAPPN